MVESTDDATIELFNLNNLDEEFFRKEVVQPHVYNMFAHYQSMHQSYLTVVPDVDLSKVLHRNTQCVSLNRFTEQVIYASPVLVQRLAVHEVRAILTRIRLEPLTQNRGLLSPLPFRCAEVLHRAKQRR